MRSKKFVVTVRMVEHQDIREFELRLEADTPMQAQARAVGTLNNVLSYAPIDSLVESISVRPTCVY